MVSLLHCRFTSAEIIDLVRFVRRKGLAYGVAWAGTGFGGSVVPFVLDWLLRTYGARASLSIWAVVQVRDTANDAGAMIKAHLLTSYRSSLALVRL